MNSTEQGVVKKNKHTSLAVCLLLLLVCSLPSYGSASSGNNQLNTSHNNNNTQHVFIVYSLENNQHKKISQGIADDLKHRQPNLIISHVSAQEKTKTIVSQYDLIVAIGNDGIDHANRTYPKIKKLLITANPKLNYTSENNAVLFMTQPYCRQMKFINALNDEWKIISILHSRDKPINQKAIQQCARRYGMQTYLVSLSADENIKIKIKHALNHSDVLLALPDGNIYNSSTVKNILLTSYRYRKPVIAFSKNFVNAGALAAIHSMTGQIAASASNLIQQYFDSGMHFNNVSNHPEKFSIDLNRQVFRALDITLPDTNTLKQSLKISDRESL